MFVANNTIKQYYTVIPKQKRVLNERSRAFGE